MRSTNICLSRVTEGKTRRNKPRVKSANTMAEHFAEIMKEWSVSWRLQFSSSITKPLYSYTYTKIKLQNTKNKEDFNNSKWKISLEQEIKRN